MSRFELLVECMSADSARNAPAGRIAFWADLRWRGAFRHPASCTTPYRLPPCTALAYPELAGLLKSASHRAPARFGHAIHQDARHRQRLRLRRLLPRSRRPATRPTRRRHQRPPLRRRRRRPDPDLPLRASPTPACGCSTPTAPRPRCAATASAASPSTSTTTASPAKPQLKIETGRGVLTLDLEVKDGKVDASASTWASRSSKPAKIPTHAARRPAGRSAAAHGRRVRTGLRGDLRVDGQPARGRLCR